MVNIDLRGKQHQKRGHYNGVDYLATNNIHEHQTRGMRSEITQRKHDYCQTKKRNLRWKIIIS